MSDGEQEGAGPLFQNTPAFPGRWGRLRRIASRLKPRAERYRDDGLTRSGQALAYRYLDSFPTVRGDAR
jgi:hypothetical protein